MLYYPNPRAARRDYDAPLRDILSLEAARAARALLAGWSALAPRPTPLVALPSLAAEIGVAAIDVKDESARSPLGSFKALGAPHALLRLIERRLAPQRVDAAALLAGRCADALRDLVVVSATDGNHGRALAAAAAAVGCRCVIVLHAQVGAEREAAIAELGAEIVRVAGNYDESVVEAARLAAAHGWEVVSDTSYPGYEAVPRDVMQGYGVIADELLELAGDDCPYTHVIVQGGVGGFAAAMVAAFWQRWGARRPHCIVVEPAQADCLQRSAIAGAPARACGSVDSLMAGLACGEASPLAWRVLEPAVDGFCCVDDAQALAAMRVLAAGRDNDMPLLAGESGAAGLAGLRALLGDADARRAAALDADSRVLLVNTEGATAPALYAKLVGRTPQAVLAAQQARRAAQSIDADALLARIERLAAVGAVEAVDGSGARGVSRIALSDADRDGRDLLVRMMRELGLEVRVDRIGNVFGVRAGRGDAAPVMCGSHIDTVARGGRLDGAYGVLAALEVVRWLDARALRTHRALVVAAFTNEEGVRFQPDMMGSLVHAGGLALDEALDARDGAGLRLGDELARIGYAGDMDCGAIRPHAFVELHIEQGPVLEAEGRAIGAVDGVQGISWQQFTIRGKANHAGTTPMHLRRDAGHAAAAIAVFVRELARRCGGVATVGTIELQPNLINVIASRARVSVDLRHVDDAALHAAEAELAAFVQQLAEAEGVDIETRRLARFAPVAFDARLVRHIEAAAAAHGHAARRISSGAGHDAQMIARIAPAAMIFVPSAAGISHNPREHTDAAQLALGATVLRDVLLALAQER